MADWMACESRGPWVANSLKNRIAEMRRIEIACRKAFNKEWMGVPANYLADCYDEARQVFERRLAEIEAAKASPISSTHQPGGA